MTIVKINGKPPKFVIEATVDGTGQASVAISPKLREPTRSQYIQQLVEELLSKVVDEA